MSRTRCRGALTALGCVALIASAAMGRVATAEVAKWDQERVTKIATELAEALKDVRVAVEKDPGQTDMIQQRAKYQVRESVRLLVNTSRQLARQLGKGEGMIETEPIYKRMQMLRADAAEAAQRTPISEDVLAKVAVARDALTQLAPYYEADWKAGPQAGQATGK